MRDRRGRVYVIIVPLQNTPMCWKNFFKEQLNRNTYIWHIIYCNTFLLYPTYMMDTDHAECINSIQKHDMETTNSSNHSYKLIDMLELCWHCQLLHYSTRDIVHVISKTVQRTIIIQPLALFAGNVSTFLTATFNTNCTAGAYIMSPKRWSLL